MEIFAKLEVVAGRQILAELVSGDEGPQIRIRRDGIVSCEITKGPWSDDDEGWNAAEAAFAATDLTAEAAQIDLLAFEFTPQPE